MTFIKNEVQANNQAPTMNLLGMPNRIDMQAMQVNHYKIRLNCDISYPEDFNEELNIIENATENDSITIILNTNGGMLDTTIEFLSAMDSADSHIHAHIAGCAHSAGSILFLKSHSWSISKYATMMIHAPSSGFIGKYSDQFAHMDHFRKWIDNFYRDVYEDFLSDEEITNVLNGTDIWLDAEQLEERLIKLSEIRTEKMEQAMLEEDSEDVPLLDADKDLEDQEGDCIGDCKNSVEASQYDSEEWFEVCDQQVDSEWGIPLHLNDNDHIEVEYRSNELDKDAVDSFDWLLKEDSYEIVKYRVLSVGK